MTVYLLKSNDNISGQSAFENALKGAVPNLVEAASLAEILNHASTARSERPIVLITAPSGSDAYFERIMEFGGQYGGILTLVLIGDEISISNYKRLIRNGITDYIAINSGVGEVMDAISRLRVQNSPVASRPEGSRPVTISFVPSAGGVGNATLLIETAALLNASKAEPQRKICIVDLDFQTSHICDYLDSEARLQIGELSSAPERLDFHLFDSFRTRHSSGIDVFAAPRSKFSSDTLNIDALDALFSMIARRYDLVLIDNPSAWFPWTSQVIAASDGAIITGINTIPCLRQVSEALSLVRSSGTTALEIAIAINRCERTVLGSISRRKHVEMVLRDERLFLIGVRPEAVESVNMGIPMVLSSSATKARKDFAPLAEFCGGLKSSRLLPT